MSDPFIRSQSNRQNLGSTRFTATGKTATPTSTPTDAQVAEEYSRSAGPTGTKERLNNFLSKLETTWQLFNKSSAASGEGELPEDGRLALLSDGEAPTPETLKMLRARLKEQSAKPEKSSQSLYQPAQSKGSEKQAKPGPQQSKSPEQTQNRAMAEGQKPSSSTQQKSESQQSKAPASQPKPEPKPAPKQAPRPTQAETPKPPPRRPESQRLQRKPTRFEPPRVEQQAASEQKAPQGKAASGGSVLGRKPGSASQANQQATPKPPEGGGKARQQAPEQQTRPQQSMGQRRPQLLRQPGGRGGPAGTPSSKAFLGSSTQSQAQLRSSDSSGRPGAASYSAPTRQAVFSQNLGQVHPKLKKRQVSSQMPVHNSFLDECHEERSGESGPIRLSWGQSKTPKTPAQRVFAHRQRLQFSRQGGSGRSLGKPLSLGMNSSALAAARADVGGRVAGAAIGTLLKDLYEEEDLEKLDEETAVTSLGLILRLGGEFTYEHSTRVLDLALELADEVGVRDKETRKEIKFGTVLRDVGEFDLLLQGEPDRDQRMKEFSGFLAGQDMLRAGLLHDIGKVKIPPEILYKPGKLTEEEYELMKMHPIYGEEIVRPIASLRYLCPTIRGHHERWDGKGYPDKLVGEKIPLAARIISVADVFDALAAERPYKRGMEVHKVKVILAEGRGTHFDPFLVDAFLEVISRRYPDS